MTDSSTPKVSVCMPVYNGSEYIAKAIDSVLAQTYENFNLLICDNCSTDNTEEIVHQFKDPRITYVRNTKNLGLVGNANRCLELSDGKYVNIFHHDDIMLPNNLELKVKMLEDHPEVGLVHSNIKLIDSKGKIIANNIWNPDSRRDYIEKGLSAFIKYIDFLPHGASFFIGAVLFRRECYKTLGGFEPKLPHCNDSEMWMRILLFHDVACIGNPLVKYRVHISSTSTSWGDWHSLPYFNEHLLASSIIFDKYNNKIPRLKVLRRRVNNIFSERAVFLANWRFTNGDHKTAIKFLKQAIIINPKVMMSKRFIKTVGKITLGEKGHRIYLSFKNKLFDDGN